MAILLAFAPFIAFALVSSVFSPIPGLIAGAVTAIILLLRDWIGLGHTPKILEIGTVVLFGGLAALVLFGVGGDWSILSVRLRVDGGLLAIVLISLAARRPFTLQYARERVGSDLWDTPNFIRTNYIITAVWALAFLIMVGADLLMLYSPYIPRQIGVILTIAALVGAFKFTGWYPEHLRSKSG